jgi:hypothetical protein
MKPRHIPGFDIWSAGAIFLGAFLLFQVQPIISKMILPWFGGSPAVWTTCLLFFQVLLLAGYSYADALSRLRQPSRQALIHLVLLAIALMLLPITPRDSWKPPDGAHPAWRILVVLASHVGWPYFLLSATSPLLQAWFARAYPERSPYRLYALSNAGSLLALVSYPFLVEPTLTTSRQGLAWSVLFVSFALCCAVLTRKLWRVGPLRSAAGGSRPSEGSGAALPAPSSVTTGWAGWLVWLLLPALASALLLAVTNHLCQNVAVIPLLWVAPLGLYLLSFIISFDHERWYERRWYSLGAILGVAAASYLNLVRYMKGFFEDRGYDSGTWTYLAYNMTPQLIVYLEVLFLVCMLCHGELARRRPPVRQLTTYYLTISAGGALGGLFVAVLCPLVFRSFFELQILLFAGYFLALGLFRKGDQPWPILTSSRLLQLSAALLGAALTAVVVWGQLEGWDREPCLVRERNFYGVVSVRERYPNEPAERGLALFHGGIIHGYQFHAADKRNEPTTYYTTDSGVGRTLEHLRRGRPLRVGCVGLGVGTVAAYGKLGDHFCFYEINPLVITLAQERFTFLRDSQATIQVVEGDARLSLERESQQQADSPRQSRRLYDVLVLDAFSGDAIPVHLLTREAFALYRQHLRDDGVLAVHISNRHLNLAPVVSRIAQHFDWPCVEIRCDRPDTTNQLAKAPYDWMLVTRNQEFLAAKGIRDVAQFPTDFESYPLWTDQYSNLFQILR